MHFGDKVPQHGHSTFKVCNNPLRKGRITSIVPGARPNMRLASSPTASTRSLPFTRLTTDGSRMTTPCPRSATSVLAVPRSIAKSLDKRLLSFLMSKVYSLLLVRCLLHLYPNGGPHAHLGCSGHVHHMLRPRI